MVSRLDYFFGINPIKIVVLSIRNVMSNAVPSLNLLNSCPNCV